MIGAQTRIVKGKNINGTVLVYRKSAGGLQGFTETNSS